MTTPTIERCREVNYRQTDYNPCCRTCQFSRTAEYAGGGTKFVCDELNIRTYKNCVCKLYKRRREE